jgi:hypothetical protein
VSYDSLEGAWWEIVAVLDLPALPVKFSTLQKAVECCGNRC